MFCLRSLRSHSVLGSLPKTCSSPYKFTTSCRRNTSSESQWQARQTRDKFAKDAKAQGYKSRAAFKLLEIDKKYRIFRPGQTVIDLGYAPGSWSQVAREKVGAGGRVIGVDRIAAEPLDGVTGVRGDFLDAETRRTIINHLHKDKNTDSRMGDVVCSDMMINTSGVTIRDHLGSMDLCDAALNFALTYLKPGGVFICKFYQGAEDRAFEKRIRESFVKVFREKPDSSRKESREGFFVALQMKTAKTREEDGRKRL